MTAVAGEGLLRIINRRIHEAELRAAERWHRRAWSEYGHWRATAAYLREIRAEVRAEISALDKVKRIA